MAKAQATEHSVCRICGNPFMGYRWNQNFYCSRVCYGRSQAIPLKTRFLAYVGQPTDCGCILWTGCVNENGYGLISAMTDRGKNILAHRLAWEFAHGVPPPADREVCHNCPSVDNPLCVNAAHLFLGTHADNMHDAAIKHQIPQGERCHFATLTDEIVLAIRARHALGGISQIELATQFGTSQQSVSRIILRQTWKHI